MKKRFITVLMFAVLTTVSCAKPPDVSSEPGTLTSSAVAEETQEPELPEFQKEYFALVEGYMGNSVFRTVDNDKTKTLSKRLMGQYDITGRSDGGELEYYLAVRREDAPVYEDFHSINVGYVDDQLFIGYYDEQSEPVVLYHLDGYNLQDMPLGYDGLDCFCLTAQGTPDAEENPAFHYAFSQSGREILDFIKSKPGLSLENEGRPAVRFYYQDEDTIDFYSEPYPCYISLTGEEEESLRRMLSASKAEDGITSSSEASHFLSKKGNLCSTGASLSIDGRDYKFYGNHELPGYMAVFAEQEFLSLEYNTDISRFVMEKIKSAVGMDYETFDPEWFKVPLQSASIKFPEYEGMGGAPDSELRTQTVVDREKLNALSLLMDQALSRGESGFYGCPYAAPIDFIREDGRTLRVFVATDSCDSMAYEGRIGFEYGDQKDLAAIFDEAMAYRLTE